MKKLFWFDTEFIDDGYTIDLISIGIVSETGNYYAVSNEFNIYKADKWVQEHVLPLLPDRTHWKPRAQIKKEIVQFIGKASPEFWVYNGAYDWVAFCQIFGHMRDLPRGYPWYANDLKQLAHIVGAPEYPLPGNGRHNALEDARWNQVAWKFLMEYKEKWQGEE